MPALSSMLARGSETRPVPAPAPPQNPTRPSPPCPHPPRLPGGGGASTFLSRSALLHGPHRNPRSCGQGAWKAADRTRTRCFQTRRLANPCTPLWGRKPHRRLPARRLVHRTSSSVCPRHLFPSRVDAEPKTLGFHRKTPLLASASCPPPHCTGAAFQLPEAGFSLATDPPPWPLRGPRTGLRAADSSWPFRRAARARQPPPPPYLPAGSGDGRRKPLLLPLQKAPAAAACHSVPKLLPAAQGVSRFRIATHSQTPKASPPQPSGGLQEAPLAWPYPVFTFCLPFKTGSLSVGRSRRGSDVTGLPPTPARIGDNRSGDSESQRN